MKTVLGLKELKQSSERSAGTERVRALNIVLGLKVKAEL